MRRFLSPALGPVGTELTLPEDAAHHFARVLRGQPGQVVELFDGSGHAARVEVQRIDDDGVHGVITELRADEATRTCVLVLAVLKGNAMDTAIRMATEAGAAAIYPVFADRSVARGDRGDRWSRIAASAAQQCGRSDVPAIQPATTLAEAISTLAADHALYIGVVGQSGAVEGHGDVAVFVGPEGGFTDSEIGRVLAHGGHPISLGPWTLRADTAAAVAVAQAMR